MNESDENQPYVPSWAIAPHAPAQPQTRDGWFNQNIWRFVQWLVVGFAMMLTLISLYRLLG